MSPTSPEVSQDSSPRDSNSARPSGSDRGSSVNESFDRTSRAESSVPPSQGQRLSDNGAPLDFQLKLLSRRANEHLGLFFNTSEVHARFYWLVRALVRHHAVRSASAMAFDLFLALIPMLALAGWTVSHLLENRPQALLESSVLVDLTPSELRAFLKRNLQAFEARRLAPAALLICWWLSSSAFYTMISLFEENFDCKPRTWLNGRLVSMGFALVGLVLFVLGSGAGFILTVDELSLLRALVGQLSAGGLLKASIFFLGVVGVSSFLALIYRFSIRRPGVQRRVWAGALTATILGLAASVGLAYYVANIARYSLFYGSLAAIVVVMLWLWLWCSAILLGAELNLALEDVRALKAGGRASSPPITRR